MVFWLRASKTALLDRVWHMSMMRKDDCTLVRVTREAVRLWFMSTYCIFTMPVCSKLDRRKEAHRNVKINTSCELS